MLTKSAHGFKGENDIHQWERTVIGSTEHVGDSSKPLITSPLAIHLFSEVGFQE